MHSATNDHPASIKGAWWRTNRPGSLSRTRVGARVRDQALSMPLALSRLLNIVRYLPLYVSSEGLRRQWAQEDAVERAFSNGLAPTPPLGDASERTSERVVEISWVLSRADRSPASTILDVGSAFAPHAYRRLLYRWARSAQLHLVDLVECNIDGATSHVADVRSLPFEDDTFDDVICISTLEHIGMDNRAYGLDGAEFVAGARDDVVALREMGRVARGHVLVTVPAGRAGDFGWFRQYSPDRWAETVAQAGLSIHEIGYFGQTPQRGWLELEPDAVEGFTYEEDPPSAGAVICASLCASR